MNLATLSWSYIRAQRLNAFLNLLLLALGIATIVILLLFSKQIEERLSRDGKGIDLVVGAKGSPIQLILSSIYHLDVPTGNIALADAEGLTRHRAVKHAIPLALGDSYRGFRIVGTTHSYVHNYGAQPARGRLWQAPMETVLGAAAARALALEPGSTFAGAHGIAAAGNVHAGSPYGVVGILVPTGTVIDRLILTSVESVWQVHDRHAPEDMTQTQATGQDRPSATDSQQREITALLVQYRSPLAAAILPRFINSQSALQAASPAFETARLLRLLGVGLDTLQVFGLLLIFTAGLGVFIALYNALKQRRYDLAIMRTLGASRRRILWHVLLEGLLLVLGGTLIGMLLGHGVAEILGMWLRQSRQMEFSGWIWIPAELWLFALAFAVGLVASILPAVQAYRTDIAKTLARG